MKPRSIHSPVLTVREISAWLQISPSTLYRLIKHHGFPAFKVGSEWRFDEKLVVQWALDQERKLREKR